MKLFSKKLTPTDCLKRLSIPSRALISLPEFHGGHTLILKVRYKTVVWPLVCTIRRIGRYKKPVLSGGWRKFVIGNGLNVGDRLTFHTVEEDQDDESSTSLHYRIELERATNPSRALGVDEETVSAISSCKDVEVKKMVIVTCSQVVGLSNSGGGDGDQGAVDSQVSECDKEETAAVVLEQSNLGLTVGGTVIPLHDKDDQASCTTSFLEPDRRFGVELDSILGQSMLGSVVNLDLTLGLQYY